MPGWSWVPGIMRNGPSNDGTHLGNIYFGSNTSLTYQQEIIIPFFNYYLKGKKDPHACQGNYIFYRRK